MIIKAPSNSKITDLVRIAPLKLPTTPNGNGLLLLTFWPEFKFLTDDI